MFELSTPAQLGIPGGPELLVILLIAVLLFGANKIPKLARSTGEAMGEFQKGREEVEQELNEMRQGTSRNAERDAAATSAEEPTAEDSTAAEGAAVAEAEPEPEEETET